MKHHTLVGIAAEIIIPIQKRGRFPRRRLENVHPKQTRDVGLARAGQKIIRHHAHERAGHNAIEFLQRGPALDRCR